MENIKILRLKVNDVVKKKTGLGIKYYLVVDTNKKWIKIARMKKSRKESQAVFESNFWQKASWQEAIISLK